MVANGVGKRLSILNSCYCYFHFYFFSFVLTASTLILINGLSFVGAASVVNVDKAIKFSLFFMNLI